MFTYVSLIFFCFVTLELIHIDVMQLALYKCALRLLLQQTNHKLCP